MNRLHPIIATVVLVCGSLFLTSGLSCSRTERKPKETAQDGAKKSIYVVNYPLKYFARRIAGEKAKVLFPAPAEGDPAFWTPDKQTILAYQQADLILLNGATYAKWVAKATLPQSKMVNTSAGFKDSYIVIKEDVVHTHGPGGMHSHAGTDFNTWVDPQQAILQASVVRDALSKLIPEHAALFQQNFNALKQDLQDLDADLKKVMSGYNKQPLVASHPVYNYLARHCGWNLKSMHWEPDEMPDETEWKKLDKLIEEHAAKWMIWEGSPKEEIVEKLKQHGVGSAIFDPCGNAPARGDYMEVMRQNVERLKPVFQAP